MKICTQCKEIKPVEEFYRQKRGKNGRKASCKSCEQIRNRKWDEKNRQHKQATWQKWYHANRDPDKERAKNHKRRVLLAGATVEKIDFAFIRERDNDLCYLCGNTVKERDRHYDHVVPLSLGGLHSNDNIRLTHSICNLRKGNKLPSGMAALDRS